MLHTRGPPPIATGYWDILRSWRASAGTGTTSEIKSRSPSPMQVGEAEKGGEGGPKGGDERGGRKLMKLKTK